MFQMYSIITCTKFNGYFVVDSSATNNSALQEYQTGLKQTYENLPEVSTQGWFDDTLQRKFINITLVKSLEKTEHNTEGCCYSPEHIIEGEVVYGTHQYVHYDEIFQINCNTYQLFLIEGNPGTGKTTLAYKVCKTWAQGKVLQNCSCIILVELRYLKPGDISVETLLAAVGPPVSNGICNEIFRTHGSGILIWLEGWDELDDRLVRSSGFHNLLHGKMLPQLSIVITTRPTATRTLKRFKFTHKFKIIGFVQEQVEKYVDRYCTDDHKAEDFMIHLNYIPGLIYLAEVPLYLAILVKLFKTTSELLPRRLTDIFSDFLMVCLQHHKEKVLEDDQPIESFDRLPSTDDYYSYNNMQTTFYSMQKCAYERFFYHSSKPFTEEEISQYFNFAKVPRNFDGLGLFSVRNISYTIGISKVYDFKFKPIQELLAALYLVRLKENDLIKELSETFGKKDYEMVQLFYAGLTNLTHVHIEKLLVKHKMTMLPQFALNLPAQSHSELVEALRKCKTYYDHNLRSSHEQLLLSLILCCYEAKNSKACRVIANHFYANNACRLDIPPINATLYLFLAVSYFISYSGKTWSLRCNNALSVSLLFKHINYPCQNLHYSESMSHLWAFCCVVTSSEIDTYCSAIKSQSSLQWIHLLPGSCLGDDGTSKLCKCLDYDSKVIRIEIDGCEVGSKGLQSIRRLLKVNRKILYIDLRNNNFSLKDVKEFLQYIKNQQHLQILLLDKNFCENSEIVAMLEDINLNRTKHNTMLITDIPFY